MLHIADDGLLAYLDDELSDDRRSEVGQHLAECEACAAELESLRSASEGLSRALERIDRPAPELDISTIVKQRESRGKRRLGKVELAKAAVLLLTIAGASAAAIPGSPVRAWLGRSLDAVKQVISPEPTAQRAAPAVESVPDAASVAVAPVDGRVQIRLTDPAADAVVRVQLIEGSQAVVWSTGARYRTGAGWIEVLESGSAEVRIELPRSLRSARIELNGRPVAIKEGPMLRLLTFPDSSESELLFRVGG